MKADTVGALNLGQWLEHIQSLHPVEIDMGLERVSRVARRLGLIPEQGAQERAEEAGFQRLAPLIITVAGTNGKGSCVALLDSLLRAAGMRVGTYTSPHLLHYNERVCVQGHPVPDNSLCSAFKLIAEAQQDTSLSYFEYSTLAALLIFRQAQLDAVILEVGLGGRLDAVNIIDADLAVISSIGLDHQDYLGDTRELIGAEKAGILRRSIPVVFGDTDLPLSVQQQAQELGCPLYQQGVDYGFETTDSDYWGWWGSTPERQSVRLQDLPRPGLDLCNAATVLQVLALLPQQLSLQAIHAGLDGLVLPGRFQSLPRPPESAQLLVDVAHNPHAAALLADKLQALRSKLRRSDGSPGQVHMIVAMMQDKDQAGFFQALGKTVDFWYIAHFDQARCMAADELHRILRNCPFIAEQNSGSSHEPAQIFGPFDDLLQALELANAQSAEGDIIVASGSFYTVAGIMQLSNDSAFAP